MAPQNITAWLRAVLAADFPESRRLSSHSLKATGLSWAASAGVPLETRRLLAHHVHDSARSTETYSRDVLAPAARVFEEVLLAMKKRAFSRARRRLISRLVPAECCGISMFFKSLLYFNFAVE